MLKENEIAVFVDSELLELLPCARFISDSKNMAKSRKTTPYYPGYHAPTQLCEALEAKEESKINLMLTILCGC